MVDRIRDGEFAFSSASLAALSPFWASRSSRVFLAETSAISAIESRPFKIRRKKMMMISEKIGYKLYCGQIYKIIGIVDGG
jgi:hypothetical protein